MSATELRQAYSALRRFTSRREAHESCDLCALPIDDRHDHLLELATRRIACACRACALLFPEGHGVRFRSIRSRALPLRDTALTDDDFLVLQIPVRLFYLCPSRVHDTVFALYPNVAGATEATLPWPAWEALLHAHPTLSQIEPEVEGLLCDHIGGRSRCFIASLDVSRHLVGLLGRSRRLSDAIRFLDGLEGGVA